MDEGIALFVGKWLLAFLPIIILLFTILFLKWDAPKSGAISWITAVLLGMFVFGADSQLLALANSKGMSLALYVLLIVWTAVFLYNIVEKVGAIKVIGDYMIGITDDKALQCLIMAWCFAPFMQGIAGFGVPVAVVAPIMVVMGFQPAVAVATCLVGYCWSISFGSMGSSFYTIQLVTSIPAVTIGTWMAIIFIVPIFMSGFGTLFIYGGKAAVKHGAPAVLVTGTVISFSMWFLNVLDAGQLATLIPALLGCCSIAMLGRTKLYSSHKTEDQSSLVIAATALNKMSFNLAFTPYYILILLSLLAQVKGIAHVFAPFSWGLDYPTEHTIFGYVVKGEITYARISLFSHPGPLLLVAALAGSMIFKRTGHWRTGIFKESAAKTIKQCVNTSIGIFTMVMMAITMNDAGITTLLANGMAGTTGQFFPVFAPYIGVLGAFLTGSNTNANVMFGALQIETAKVLGISTVIMAAVQSVGAALGCSVAPATVLLGSTTVGMSGREGEVMNRTAPYCLGISLMVGLNAWLFAYVLFKTLP
jgi:lactate permease